MWKEYKVGTWLRGNERVKAFPYGHALNKRSREKIVEIQLMGTAKHPKYQGHLSGLDIEENCEIFLKPDQILWVYEEEKGDEE